MSVPGDGHVKRDQPITSWLGPASTGQLHGPDRSEMSDRKLETTVSPGWM